MALAARAVAPLRPKTLHRKRIGMRFRRVRVRVASKGTIIALAVGAPLLLIVAYVWLTAQLTAQSYRLHDAQARQVALLQQEAVLRQDVASLESLPRLEAAAAKLHMTVPTRVALVAPAATETAQRRSVTTIAASIAGIRHWFALR